MGRWEDRKRRDGEMINGKKEGWRDDRWMDR